MIVVGDQVEAELTLGSKKKEVEAYILSVQKRKNTFCRASYGKMQILSSNIDAVCIISSLDQPKFRNGFIDRVLVEAFCSPIRVFVVLNKIDLLQENIKMHTKTIHQIKHYESMGIHTFQESFKSGVSDPLKSMINGHQKVLLVGQSGVGKSSFINRLFGKPMQHTTHVSSNNKGRHATTNPKLCIWGGFQLIDIPGVREFGLQHRLQTEIAAGFPEFSGACCKFENCTHIHEPGCGVLKMLTKTVPGLPRWRYDSYLSIIKSMKEKHRYRRGDHRN